MATDGQFSVEGSNPGGGRPIFTRGRRIFFTSPGSVMTARMRIFEEQRGQIKGSISWILAISLAHAERQEDSGTKGEEGCGEESLTVTPWASFQPRGA